MAESFSSLANPFLEYRDTLAGGADYAAINDGDEVDNFYDTAFEKAFTDTGYLVDIDIIGGEGGVGGGQVDYSPTRILNEQEYRGFVADTPAYLSGFGSKPTVDKTQQAYSTVKDLTSTEELSAALSSFYGYNVVAKEQSFNRSDFGGNLDTHSSSSDSNLQQFHSLVEPILKDQVSYLQATKGLSYQDALMESYSSDPMLQALYHKYDVKPVRQTKDGSTYLYDPFSFSEIRTFESKDPSIKSIGVDIAKAVALTMLLGPVVEAGLTAANMALATAVPAAVNAAVASTAVATMATAATVSAVLGGDPLQAALVAGLPIGRIPIPGTNGMTIDQFVTNAGKLNTGQFQVVLGATPMGTAMAAANSMIPTGTGGGSTTGATPDFNPYINSIAASVSASNLEEEEQESTVDFTFNPYAESEEVAAASSATTEAENASNAAQEALNTPSSYTSAIDDYEGRYKEAMIKNRGRKSSASRYYLEKIRKAEAAEKQELNEKRIAANVAKGMQDKAASEEKEIRSAEERTYQAEKAAAFQAYQAEDAARKERNRIRLEKAKVARETADALKVKEAEEAAAKPPVTDVTPIVDEQDPIESEVDITYEDDFEEEIPEPVIPPPEKEIVKSTDNSDDGGGGGGSSEGSGETGVSTPSPTPVESGSSGNIDGEEVDPNTNIIYRQLIEAANQEEDGSLLQLALLEEASAYKANPEIYESDAFGGPSTRPWDVDPENWVEDVVTAVYVNLSSLTPPSTGGKVNEPVATGEPNEVESDITDSTIPSDTTEFDPDPVGTGKEGTESGGGATGVSTGSGEATTGGGEDTTGGNAGSGEGEGIGKGDGKGEGEGEGEGGGSGAGAGGGMFGGGGGGGAGERNITETLFSDYARKYQAPALLNSRRFQGYQAPSLFKGII